jgi:hypothetical protein
MLNAPPPSNLMEAKTDEERAEAFEELQIAKTTVKDLVGQVSAEGRTVWTFAPTQNLLSVLDYFAKGTPPSHHHSSC